MDRTTRFLIQTLVVFGAACVFFAFQPWMEGTTGWLEWYWTIRRAGEVMAIYALGHGLLLWAEQDPARWQRIRIALSITATLLFIHALINDGESVENAGSPLLQDYMKDWSIRPYRIRAMLAACILAFAFIMKYKRVERAAFIASLIIAVLYRLTPELHILISPIEDACC